MIATLYTWRGSPQDGGPRQLGQVRVVDGRAEWDAGIDRLMRQQVARGLDPAQGDLFVSELPGRLRNAPYLWAEATEHAPPPDPPPNPIDRYVWAPGEAAVLPR